MEYAVSSGCRFADRYVTILISDFNDSYISDFFGNYTVNVINENIRRCAGLVII